MSNNKDDLFFARDCFNNVIAKLRIVGSSYILLKGSRLTKISFSSLAPREKLIIQKANKNCDNILLEDLICSSASQAANLITGFQTNGKIFWKNTLGQTLKDLMADEIYSENEDEKLEISVPEEIKEPNTNKLNSRSSFSKINLVSECMEEFHDKYPEINFSDWSKIVSFILERTHFQYED